mmetsp:Transcript_26666/g.84873  ORF Transcript_26666/g.84873 Transcript_26666/m.84873 type:complete len:180 (-) Transcript_26666:295-834(-)
MLSHLECPTPFLIGIHSSFAFKKDFPFLLDAVVVDLDRGTIDVPSIACSGSDPSRGQEFSTSVPPELGLPATLRTELVAEVRSLLQPDFRDCDCVSPPPSGGFPAAAIRTAFHGTIERLLAGVEAHCVPFRYENASSDHLVIFDEESYLDRVTASDRPFFDVFVRTQAFSSYLSALLDP